MNTSKIVTLSVIATTFLTSGVSAADIIKYVGMCEPSGAVALPEASFGDMFIVADDEGNVLRVYRTEDGGAPLTEFDVDAVLEPTPEREADFEAATWLGGRVYWIGSHSRNREGKLRKDRWQFFSTTSDASGGTITIEMQPPISLHSLLDRIANLDIRLRDEIRVEEREVEGLAPDNGGLSIEGLTVTSDGAGLLIGLRSPLIPSTPDPDRPETIRWDAVVIPFSNPEEALDGAEPVVGPLIPIKLDGRGIRSMEYAPSLGAYLLIAGPVGGNEPFALYRWSGLEGEDPVMLEAATGVLADLEHFTPEAMIVAPEGDKVFILSDDGDICSSAQSFRGAVIDIE